MQPVLEVYRPKGFTLWPVAWSEPFSYLPLSGTLLPGEVGTAVMGIAAANGIDPEDDRPQRPTGPLDAFLHGLLAMEPLFAPGGLRVVDTAVGTTLLPGCCSGIEAWRDWWGVDPERYVPNRAAPLAAVLARALDVPAEGSPRVSYTCWRSWTQHQDSAECRNHKVGRV